jgi:diacylglycerol O-acyltransferase / wax synthase
MPTHPMTPVDAAWFHIDGPVNLAQVTGIVLTREPLDFQKVLEVYRHRTLPFPRFRQRVVERGFPIATPQWEDVPCFDIEQHVHHIGLPKPRDEAALAELVSDLASTPLDREQPLWQAHIVDDVAGGSAFILRFHHCIGDGTAMMAFARELFDATPDAPAAREAPPVLPAGTGLLDGLLGSAYQTVEWSTRTVMSTLDTAVRAVMNPGQAMEKASALVDGATALARELLKTPDPCTPLKGVFGARKRVAWSAPVPLDDVKAIGAAWDAKVNDVLVAAMTGALRSYLADRGVPVDDITLRAMVPVDLRPPERAMQLGNEFGLVILDLAIDAADAVECLGRTKAHMDALKRSPEAVAIMALFHLFGRAPKMVEDFAVDLFSSKASLVMTNVAGPRQPLYFAGSAIDRIMFWVPHPGKQLGMGVSIFSYNGAVSLAVVSDKHLLPDPEAITERFSRQFAEMLQHANGRAAGTRRGKARSGRAR